MILIPSTLFQLDYIRINAIIKYLVRLKTLLWVGLAKKFDQDLIDKWEQTFWPTPYNMGTFSSVAQSCPTLCDPMNRSMPGLPVHHQLPEFTQTHVHWVSDAIQPSHPMSSPSPPTFNLSKHQGLFKWVSSSHQVAKILEFPLHHPSFQWIFRTNFL